MIRNKLYVANEYEIKSLAQKLQDTLYKLPGNHTDEAMEETEIRYALDKAQEALSDAQRAIEYFTKPVHQGVLVQNNNGKFVLKFDDGGSSYPFSCGSSIEIYLAYDLEESGWYAGRVEHTTRDGQTGYYFYGPGKPFLYSCMKARIRE